MVEASFGVQPASPSAHSSPEKPATKSIALYLQTGRTVPSQAVSDVNLHQSPFLEVPEQTPNGGLQTTSEHDPTTSTSITSK